MQGLIAGILQTMGQLGTALAFAIASSLIHGGTPQELLGAYRNSFYTAAAFAAVALVITVFFIKTDAAETIVVEAKDLETASTSTVVDDKRSDQDVVSVTD